MLVWVRGHLGGMPASLFISSLNCDAPSPSLGLGLHLPCRRARPMSSLLTS